MDTRICFLLLSLFLFCLPSSTLSARCNANDKKVLMSIKKSLNNPYHLASWTSNTGCCDWYSVECDPNTNRIIALTIFQANISGQIPAAVGDLPYLETLIFRHITNLTGQIPPSIAKLKNLKMVRLSWTNLSGSVPGFFSQLPNLDYLDLSFNQLSGPIPASLSKLTKLNALHLDRNKLTGYIPDSFGKFSGNVPDLYLSHNQLSGEIPKSFGNISFGTIDLSRNKLVGDASMLFNPNGSTQMIDVSRNLLEFDLSKARFPKSLTNLDLSHNKIRGSLPAELTGLNLQLLNVSYNRLCGEIPSGGKLQDFDYTSYFHNRCLCGPPLANC
ncbi:hypothetical protein HHK36_017381 [Tetracentron sinense]|uniref:Leucine-rich repeat-containing N-terminal plant-type domain-containing protein n=1 Tax=Tetracentron sinense TaxID=13715 RepID=A0A834Z580_TETSI|nr:hypothetical protein HHK36_017381 [Tetracentron sinense]